MNGMATSREFRRLSHRMRDSVSLSVGARSRAGRNGGAQTSPGRCGCEACPAEGGGCAGAVSDHQPTALPGRFAAEIPEMEKRRAGLDATLRLWIILDEYNQDTIGRSFYLEPEPPLGRFSKAFFLPLMKEFIARRASTRGVNRRR
jgi:hypothetical protein